MKQSNINITIDLDDENVPQKIAWNASDAPNSQLSDAKAMALSLWDPDQKNTLRMDLWTGDMPVHEMKQFCIESMGGIAESIKNATNDEEMADEIIQLCDKFAKKIEEEQKNNAGQ